MTTTLESGIDVALRMGFYQMLAYDMAKKCRAMLDARPVCDFTGLEPGKTYVHKPAYGNGTALVTVEEVTPKRTQAVASVNGSVARRIYRGYYAGTFSELDADLIALSSIKHEEVVKAALERGLDVPPRVRRLYPALFIEIPERFAQAQRHTAAERVKNALNPDWVRHTGPIGPTTFDAQIEEAHRQIAILQDTRVQAVVANPDTKADYDRYIAEHRADIDFYRWLRRLVDVGGVFYIMFDTFVECAHCGLLVWQGAMPATTGVNIPGNHEPVECEGVALPSKTAVCPGSEILGRIVQEWWFTAPQA